jgi:predicted secreted protein
MVKLRLLAICLIMVLAPGFILNGATSVTAANEVTVDESSSGGQIAVVTGDTVKVVLEQQSASTGYIWELAGNSHPGVLNLVDHTTQPPSIPGGIGTDTWTFSAVATGTSTIYLEYSQPWPAGDKNARSFTLKVNVYNQLPPAVPASSNWLICLMIAGVIIIMACVIAQRTSKS